MLSASVRRLAAAAAAAWCMALPGHAGVVDFVATPLGEGVWRYDYSITAPAFDFDQFTLYFDISQFGPLSAAIGPAGWDMLSLDPDPAIPADGLLDGLHLDGPLPQGATVTGFSVNFRYLGLDTPGAQPFELLDSSSLRVLQSSVTTAVPEPRPALLFVAGALGLGVLGTRRRRQDGHAAVGQLAQPEQR